MVNDLRNLFIEKITGGLKKKSITDPAAWSLAHRIMGKPFPGKWTFKWHPWLYEMHKCKSEMIAAQKASQLGFTEWGLNVTFFKIDIEQVDCLYVLPSKTPDASNFSSSRFDPALELSPYLFNLFNDVKNVGHKRAGTTNLYIRGSRSRSGLKSVPVGLIILDEVDEFTQKNIPLAFERTSGQREHQVILISTPTIDTVGINRFYIQSTKEEYFFSCPYCSRFTHLTFPDCLEITAESLDELDNNGQLAINNSFLKCKECSHKLEHETKFAWLENKIGTGSDKNNGTAIWVPEHSNRDIRGFHINHLYSSTVSPVDLAKAYLKANNDVADEQTFWNDKIGVPHVVEGSRLTDYQINNCKSDYLNGNLKRFPSRITTIGIDVGKWIHYEIDNWILPNYIPNQTDLNTKCEVKVLEVGKVLHFEELDNLMSKYRVIAGVIDANPERRKAYEFASRFWGHIKLCFYGTGIHGKQINEPKLKATGQNNEPTITVDRTSWLDLSLGRFRNNTITIPSNIPLEYVDQLKTLTRIYEKDKEGNAFGRYIKGEGQDHYAHARNYSEIALPFACHISNPQSIRSPI